MTQFTESKSNMHYKDDLLRLRKILFYLPIVLLLLILGVQSMWPCCSLIYRWLILSIVLSHTAVKLCTLQLLKSDFLVLVATNALYPAIPHLNLSSRWRWASVRSVAGTLTASHTAPAVQPKSSRSCIIWNIIRGLHRDMI